MMIAKCDIKIDEVDYQIIVNVGSMIDVEKRTGKTFMKVVKEAESGSFVAIADLLASCLCKDEKPVGFNFVENMAFDVFNDLASPLIDTIIASFPDKDNKKKVEVISPAQKR